MQKVSDEYKASMKSPLRERAYIMISFGLVNQEAQANARIDEGEFNYFSNKADIFDERTDDIVYATLEEDFTKVDGTMRFPPRENSGDVFYDTGLISKDLVYDPDPEHQATYEVTINLNMAATDFKGLTINFGENYPVNFDVVGSNGTALEVLNNTRSEWGTEEVIEDTTFIKLVFYDMKSPQSRLRIYSIRFGYGLVYYNNSVLRSSLESYVSPIGADMPQIDFTVQLKNYDHYFNVDNPTSAINYLETGQPMDIYYGYQLPSTGEIEWIRGNHLLCSDWESDDHTMTIRCQDVFRSMDSEYYKGKYTDGMGENCYDLAVSVLSDAGVTDYQLDYHLMKCYSRNPMPIVKHKEALQIIANACRCVLSQTRQGTIQIKPNFHPLVGVSSIDETPYSDVGEILNDSEKDEYGTLAANYTTANGNMFFIDRELTGGKNTGYISKSLSDLDGNFESNPIIELTQQFPLERIGVKLVFGQALPAAFVIRTYNNDEKPVTEYEVGADEIHKTTIIHHDFDGFTRMEIEFTKTAEPYNRIVLNHVALGDVNDFTMTRTDMTSSPKAIKQELIKEVIVPYYIYQNGTVEDKLLSESITIKEAGERVTFYMREPSYGYKAKLTDVEGKEVVDGTSIDDTHDQGAYFVTVEFKVEGEYTLDLFGRRYIITERYARKVLNSRGKTVKWENPLISHKDMADDLAEWLADYYNAGVEYEYSTRGNPEIDSNDIVYQENEFCKDMKVNIYRQTLDFKQSFSGKVTARRIGGVKNVGNP